MILVVAGSWPPPPHDPRERSEVVMRSEGWELRRFPATDLRHTYLAMRGMDHVQLWHEEARLSLLTPSLLTRSCFELYPIDGWKRRARSLAEAARLAYEHHGVRVPGPAMLRSFERWFLGVTTAGAHV